MANATIEEARNHGRCVNLNGGYDAGPDFCFELQPDSSVKGWVRRYTSARDAAYSQYDNPFPDITTRYYVIPANAPVGPGLDMLYPFEVAVPAEP